MSLFARVFLQLWIRFGRITEAVHSRLAVESIAKMQAKGLGVGRETLLRI